MSATAGVATVRNRLESLLALVFLPAVALHEYSHWAAYALVGVEADVDWARELSPDRRVGVVRRENDDASADEDATPGGDGGTGEDGAPVDDPSSGVGAPVDNPAASPRPGWRGQLLVTLAPLVCLVAAVGALLLAKALFALGGRLAWVAGVVVLVQSAGFAFQGGPSGPDVRVFAATVAADDAGAAGRVARIGVAALGHLTTLVAVGWFLVAAAVLRA